MDETKKIAVEQALKFADACKIKQLSVDEFLKIVNELNNFYNGTNKEQPLR